MVIILIGFIAIAAYSYHVFDQNKYITFKNNSTFTAKQRELLLKNVEYYDMLSPKDKVLFELKTLEFLANYRITGIKTKLTLLDLLLVACSATIPTFRIPKWRYTTLDEVLIYPRAFTSNFQFDGKQKGQKIAGMVGNGIMEGKMILSQKSLRLGFKNDNDKKNVGIHEFIHLIDKEDGKIDGIPELLLKHSYVIPWMHLVKLKTDEILDKTSDINRYGATNKQEFFTVTSEYFFESPQLMQQKHPSLYLALSDAFKQNPAKWWKGKRRSQIKKNSLCICGSEQKFKYCCGEAHY